MMYHKYKAIVGLLSVKNRHWVRYTEYEMERSITTLETRPATKPPFLHVITLS